MAFEMQFESEGTVELLNFMGGDLEVVNSARISFAKQTEEMRVCDEKLIHYLMRNRHGTPFETSVFTFGLSAPITVAREWVRHRISSWNEVSGRYVELEPKFFVPDREAVRTQTGKAGNYSFQQMTFDDAMLAQSLMGECYTEAWHTYQALLRKGVAKELARNVLPVGIFTQWRWTVNARSLMNFIEQRTGEHAMKEIRDMALQIDKIFTYKMPVTANAFHKNGNRSA